jgi:hypothetical protein
MPKKGNEELIELEAIFSDLKEDAKSVAKDILAYIGIFKSFGSFRYIGYVLVPFALFTIFVDTYLSAPINPQVIFDLVYLGIGILLIFLGIKSRKHYLHLRKKYLRIVEIEKTL